MVEEQQGIRLPVELQQVPSRILEVATRRTRTAGKVEIPNVDDHVSKLEHMGKETVKKLQDIKGAAVQAGVDINIPENCINKGGPPSPFGMPPQQQAQHHQQQHPQHSQRQHPHSPSQDRGSTQAPHQRPQSTQPSPFAQSANASAPRPLGMDSMPSANFMANMFGQASGALDRRDHLPLAICNAHTPNIDQTTAATREAKRECGPDMITYHLL
ncbi:hypothetical protein WJX82_006275 [Trebouxia sp. C0006]